MLVVGPDSDPYKEEIPAHELHFYQRQGTKRRRRAPDFLPPDDRKILDRVMKRAYRLDLLLNFCGFRTGWLGIIALIPWIGDAIALYWLLRLLKLIESVSGGIPSAVHAQMYWNILFDFGMGLIPIVGAIVNIVYKCNLRNFILLEQHLVSKYAPNTPAQIGVGKDKAMETV